MSVLPVFKKSYFFLGEPPDETLWFQVRMGFKPCLGQASIWCLACTCCTPTYFDKSESRLLRRARRRATTRTTAGTPWRPRMTTCRPRSRTRRRRRGERWATRRRRRRRRETATATPQSRRQTRPRLPTSGARSNRLGGSGASLGCSRSPLLGNCPHPGAWHHPRDRPRPRVRPQTELTHAPLFTPTPVSGPAPESAHASCSPRPGVRTLPRVYPKSRVSPLSGSGLILGPLGELILPSRKFPRSP